MPCYITLGVLLRSAVFKLNTLFTGLLTDVLGKGYKWKILLLFKVLSQCPSREIKLEGNVFKRLSLFFSLLKPIELNLENLKNIEKYNE